VSHDPVHFQRLRAILDQAFELRPEDREAWLDRRCAGDRELRAEIESLLASDAGEDALLDRSSGALAQGLLTLASQPDLAPGQRLGAFRIERQLASGGMGSVFLATRADGTFEQRVAVKLFHAPVRLRDLFLRERQLLARLEHPNIARLIDGGATAGGTPYYVLEYVEGVPLTDFCRRNRLGRQDRLDLFLAVCDAVSFAHRNLIVHRDLKPSNILVTADGTAKLLDFGIAKLIEQGDTEASTQTLLRLLTPAYAAPEQILGEPVTTAVDVWALGVLLYELLAERRPFAPADGGRLALEHAILNDEPQPPWGKDLSRCADLDAIALQALRKEPARRYASVDALAADLRRFLRGLPVRARGDARGYRMSKFLRRHRLAVAAAAVAALAVTGGIWATLWQARKAALAAGQAIEESRRAKLARDFLFELFHLGGADRGVRADQITARQLLDRAEAKLLGGELKAEPKVESELLDVLAFNYATIGEFVSAEKMFRRTVEIKRATLPAQDADLHYSMQLWANALADLGRLDEALKVNDEGLAVLQAASGQEGEEQLGMAWRTRGKILRLEGRLVEAARAIGKAREIHLRTDQNADGPNIAMLDLDAANVAALGGDFEAAERAVRNALRIWTARRNSRRMGLGHSALGWILTERGRPADGEAVLRQAVEELGATLSPSHPDLLAAQRRLGIALLREDKIAEGRALLEKTAGGYTAHDPFGGPQLAHLALAEADLLAGKHRQAATALAGLIPELEKILPAGDPELTLARRLAERAIGGGRTR